METKKMPEELKLRNVWMCFLRKKKQKLHSFLCQFCGIVFLLAGSNLGFLKREQETTLCSTGPYQSVLRKQFRF